ncbi:MAG: NAD-dependent epimerase/dehydratase family protein [Elusimicrobia bacterium]|nr:NAD-dependent epimerase/dehydratase family protein [Elusimicrobiota bacterium]
MKTALVTGGGGFVAGRVIPVLMARGWTVRAVVRRTADAVPAGAQAVAVGDIREADWDRHLRGVSAVVHLAARAHRMNEVGGDAEALYRRDNVEATAVLARAAVRAKVSRFVFISSVKAMGESTPIDAPWNEKSPCNPVDAYGRTKLEAERELRDLYARSGLPAVILRPPLLYGPRVKGNMQRLISWIGRGVPMPLASVRNSRSLLSVGNLADAVCAAIEHPAAVGQTYMVSDGEDMSTPELIGRIARACGKQARLLPLPPSALLLGARLAGRSNEAARLLGSLRVDSSLIRRQLGWTPPFTVDAGLMEMVRAVTS